MGKPFDNGIFSCFSDYRLCLLSFCLPCYTVGKNAEHLGDDCLLHGLLTAIGFGFGPLLRWRLRQEKDIEGSMVMDVLVYIVVPCCALIQEAKEIGWALPKSVVKAGNSAENATNKDDTAVDQTQEMSRE